MKKIAPPILPPHSGPHSNGSRFCDSSWVESSLILMD